MNQNFSISQLKRQYGRFKLLIALLILIVLCFCIGYWFGDKSLATDKKTIAEQQMRLDNLYAEVDRQLQQLNFLQVEVEVEKQAATHVQKQLQKQHEENFKLQKELSFYQKIMAPELEAGGVAIDKFNLTQIADTQNYQYKVVLVQTEKSKRFAKGHINIDFGGIQGDNSVKLNIKQLVKPFDKKSLQFSFKYFQILEGRLQLPPDFIGQNVKIVVTLPSGKWQKFEQFDRQFPFEPNQMAITGSSLIVD